MGKGSQQYHWAPVVDQRRAKFPFTLLLCLATILTFIVVFVVR